MKLKLSESLVPSVSLTVMVAVCSPGAESNTLMSSTSGPAGRKLTCFCFTAVIIHIPMHKNSIGIIARIQLLSHYMIIEHSHGSMDPPSIEHRTVSSGPSPGVTEHSYE